MPAIDYDGAFFLSAWETSDGSRGAISFPIKASRISTAERFAEKMVPKLLPGWTVGMLRLFRWGRRGRLERTWILQINEVVTSKPKAAGKE